MSISTTDILKELAPEKEAGVDYRYRVMLKDVHKRTPFDSKIADYSIQNGVVKFYDCVHEFLGLVPLDNISYIELVRVVRYNND